MLGAFPIDVVSDVVCPWCYIGKHKLEGALAQLRAREPGIAIAQRWHPFQLNPDLPPSGVDRRDYLERKFGGPDRARTIYARVSAAGQSVGIPFAFDAIERQPNTLDAHRLLAWAQSRREGNPDALVEALFKAYFVDGLYVGDREALLNLAVSAGYDPSDTRAFLASSELADAVADADRRAREMGIGGVPLFIFGGKTAVSGAQEPSVLLNAISQARA